MFRSSDLQLILLTTAAQRADGSLLPPPDSIGSQTTRIRRSISPLIKNDLVSEAVITDATLAWRDDGDVRYCAFITDAGRELIGAEPAGSTENLSQHDAPPAAVIAPEKAITKGAMVLDLLRREQGATLDELVLATGWLPHTTRAALTGIRKKGHAVAKSKRGDVSCYRIEVAA